MITLVKFIENPDPESRNPIISKTLGKYGVLNTREELPEERTPSPSEFWRVEVTKEVIIHKEGGKNLGGCFVLNPISRVGYRDMSKQEPDIDYLIPGGYETKRYKTSLVIIPQTLGFNWVAGLDIRHHLRDQYRDEKDLYMINSFVVSLDGSSEWTVEEVGLDGSRSGASSTIYSR